MADSLTDEKSLQSLKIVEIKGMAREKRYQN